MYNIKKILEQLQKINLPDKDEDFTPDIGRDIIKNYHSIFNIALIELRNLEKLNEELQGLLVTEQICSDTLGKKFDKYKETLEYISKAPPNVDKEILQKRATKILVDDT